MQPGPHGGGRISGQTLPKGPTPKRPPGPAPRHGDTQGCVTGLWHSPLCSPNPEPVKQCSHCRCLGSHKFGHPTQPRQGTNTPPPQTGG